MTRKREFPGSDQVSARYLRRVETGEIRDRCQTIVGRFMAFVEKDEPTGCWLWKGHLNNQGYPVFSDWRGGRSNIYAHRYSYAVSRAPVEEGLVIDHLCRTPRCVNPDHLEPVTQRLNVRRGYWGRKTHCPQGHPLSGEHVYIRKNGARMCRTCSRNRARDMRHRIAAARVRRCRECARIFPDRQGPGARPVVCPSCKEAKAA